MAHDLEFGKFVHIAFRMHHDYISAIKDVTSEVRWDNGEPWPVLRVTIAAPGGTHTTEWLPLRIWKASDRQGGAIHVDEGGGKRTTTADGYDNALSAAARLIAARVRQEVEVYSK